MKIYKGDRVRIGLTQNRLKEIDLIDPETVHYIQQFRGKVGQVFDITTTSTGFTNYHVNFGKEIGIFYSEEVTLVD